MTSWRDENEARAKSFDICGGGFFIDKSPDTFCSMGLSTTARNEILGLQWLRDGFWENEELQDYNANDMKYSVREIIALASCIATLEVGDVFACGTNHQGPADA